MTVPHSVGEQLEAQGIAPGSYSFVASNRMRKTIARRLTEAARDVPHFQLTLDIRSAALLAFRARMNVELGADRRLSVNDLVIVACARALIDHPQVNSSFTEDGIVTHHAADVAFAVAIPGGLITPIVRGAAALPLAEMGPLTRDLAARAGAMKLTPDEYVGGTFCVSNLGMFGIRSFTSIINPPHGAILSVGATEERVIAVDGKPVVEPMMTVTLNCDHRVVDGATGAKFLAHLKAILEDPEQMNPAGART